MDSPRYIRVKVTAGARKESLEEKRSVLHISVKEKAEENKANARVFYLVARHLGLATKRLQVHTGHHRPSKMLVIV